MMVYDWCRENNKSFDSDKIEFMSYFCNANNSEFHNPIYLHNNGKDINQKEHVKDLGVYMSSSGSFMLTIPHQRPDNYVDGY